MRTYAERPLTCAAPCGRDPAEPFPRPGRDSDDWRVGESRPPVVLPVVGGRVGAPLGQDPRSERQIATRTESCSLPESAKTQRRENHHFQWPIR